MVKNDRGLPYFLFQYNTCFYLSFLSPNYGRSFLPFQYNTCFYLSDEMEEKSYKKKNFNTTLVFIYQVNRTGKDIMGSEFQYNTCFYLSNVFPPFLISIIVIFPDKFNVSLNFSQPFLFFRYFLSNRLPTAILSGLPAFRIFFRLGKPIKAAHPAAFILHYLN